MERIAIIMGKMHSGGKKNLVMEYYRHIDREKIQFDFGNQGVPQTEDVPPAPQPWADAEPASDEYWASLMAGAAEEPENGTPQ